jgi:hypothetical protein
VAGLLSERNRSAALARALDASTSRERGGEFVTRESRSSRAALATWSTARSKAGWFTREGRVKPLSLRTNCREDALTSSSVAGGLKLCNVLMLRHISVLSAMLEKHLGRLAEEDLADGFVVRVARLDLL